MAGDTAEVALLLAIKPQYARRIFTGEKRVEFRKTIPRGDIAHVVLYATRPVSRIVGRFKLAAVETDTPSRLWRKYHHIAGIDHSDYMAYFANTSRAVGILVEDPVVFAHPRPLSAVSGVARPPQGLQYVGLDRIRGLLRAPVCD